MSRRFILPPIPQEQRTPLVQTLLGLIEGLAQRVQKQEEDIAHLKDEIRVLKGQKGPPRFKPSKMQERTNERAGGGHEADKRRPGSDKRSKNAELTIHEEKILPLSITPPGGSRFKGYRDVVVQNLIIRAHNTRYGLARWQLPSGEFLTARLPKELIGQRYGTCLRSYVLYQHHHCQVTQPLLLEQLREWGIDISSGGIDAMLSADQDRFHAEKDALLEAGLSSASSITVDDTGARHRSRNGFVTTISNRHFAWFKSTASKSRINFLELLCAGTYSPRSIALLGCAGGNGLERIDVKRIERVVCVDINSQYVEQVRARFGARIPGLETLVGDIQSAVPEGRATHRRAMGESHHS